MKPDMYRRNIAARAFDVARYLLFFGIPTGVGQVTSIRTLEKQIRRLRASPYPELCELAGEIAEACTRPPSCRLPDSPDEPVAPTLARHVDPDTHAAQASAALAQWAEQNLPARSMEEPDDVDVVKLADPHADIAATLLYPVTDRPFRELYEMAASWSAERRNEVIETALGSRTSRDELLRGFRSSTYGFDIVMDIGAYRDLHRHRRCHQFRQYYSAKLGYDVPEAISRAGLEPEYRSYVENTFETFRRLPAPGREYILPFATRSRFLFKMDFAEIEYMSRLRSGVKGHFSYRRIAWEISQKFAILEPHLGRLIEATPPWIDDPLKR